MGHCERLSASMALGAADGGPVRVAICLLLGVVVVTLNIGDVSANLEERSAGICPAAGNSTRVADDCLRLIVQLVRRYVRRLDRGMRYDFCRHFQVVQECLQPLFTHCPEFHKQHHHLIGPILDHMTCACDDTTDSTSCREDMVCFEGEHRGLLTRRCSEMLDFNLRQNTQSRCFFEQESVSCKVALVSSGCGATAATFAYNLLRLVALYNDSTKHCPLTLPTDYDGFQYNADCPTIFVLDMKRCAYKHSQGHILRFSEENDLVVDGSRKEVKVACRNYRLYQLCMRPIKKACRAGTKLLMGYQGAWRKYNMKMDYICTKENRPTYTRSLRCYQGILANDSLQECNHIWKDLKPWVHSVTAYQFFCREDTHDASLMRQELDRLRSCYERVFRGRCGQDAGAMMGHMISMAFQDPAYLRYGYKPNCRLHRKRHRWKVTPAHLTTPVFEPTVHVGSGAGASMHLAHRGTSQFNCAFITVLLLLLHRHCHSFSNSSNVTRLRAVFR